MRDPYVSTSGVDAWEAAYEQSLADEAQQQADRAALRAAGDPDCVDFSAEQRAADAVASHVVTREEAEAARKAHVPDIFPDRLDETLVRVVDLAQVPGSTTDQASAPTDSVGFSVMGGGTR
jgi:hypothetical protein